MPYRFTAITLMLSLCANAEEWPGFRGPTGQGISTEKGLPTKWSATDNVAWKTAIPGEAWSSPIVWGDRVFVTTVTDTGTSCRVLALSRRDGKILWNVEVFQQPKTFKNAKNSFATPTPVTDGEHVYAVFNDGSIAALTVEGKPAWTYREIKHHSQHGLAASPILYHDTLIMPYDGSSPGPDKGVGWQKPWEQAIVLALDKKTGKERWRGKRGLSRIGHATPVVVNVKGQDVMISTAGDVVQGFDPKTGKRLWSVADFGEGLVPSPVVGEGLIFAASGFGKPRFRAIQLEKAEGAVERKVVWEMDRLVPMMPSMVYAKPYLYFVTEKGFGGCIEAAPGKVEWTARLGGSYSASPVWAEGRVYFLSETGETTIVEAGPKYVSVGRNELGEACQASLAVSRGQVFIRTQGHVWCIGGK